MELRFWETREWSLASTGAAAAAILVMLIVFAGQAAAQSVRIPVLGIVKPSITVFDKHGDPEGHLTKEDFGDFSDVFIVGLNGKRNLLVLDLPGHETQYPVYYRDVVVADPRDLRKRIGIAGDEDVIRCFRAARQGKGAPPRRKSRTSKGLGGDYCPRS